MKTLAILLGAHRFPRLDSVEPMSSLAESSRLFKDYLLSSSEFLGLNAGGILDLFDSGLPPGGQAEAIYEHLEAFIRATPGAKDRNVILHYVGHGLVLDTDSVFALAIRHTKKAAIEPTALRISDIAYTLRQQARFARKFVILDCCFAASAMRYFQADGGATTVVGQQMAKEFSPEGAAPPRPAEAPTRGVSLLCAADKYTPARAPPGMETTLFSAALLHSLQPLGPDVAPLTFQELGDRIWERIVELNGDVRPVVLSPDQQEGDIARLLRIFPLTQTQSESHYALTSPPAEADAPKDSVPRSAEGAPSSVQSETHHAPTSPPPDANAPKDSLLRSAEGAPTSAQSEAHHAPTSPSPDANAPKDSISRSAEGAPTSAQSDAPTSPSPEANAPKDSISRSAGRAPTLAQSEKHYASTSPPPEANAPKDFVPPAGEGASTSKQTDGARSVGTGATGWASHMRFVIFLILLGLLILFLAKMKSSHRPDSGSTADSEATSLQEVTGSVQLAPPSNPYEPSHKFIEKELRVPM